jgi:hypothetical protein
MLYENATGSPIRLTLPYNFQLVKKCNFTVFRPWRLYFSNRLQSCYQIQLLTFLALPEAAGVLLGVAGLALS